MTNPTLEALRPYTYSNRENRGWVLFRPVPIAVWRELEEMTEEENQ